MNILIFVMTMLMLLSVMTYARIESTRTFFSLRSQFEHYMQVEERSYINKRNEHLYTETHLSKKEGTNKGTSKGTGQVPVGILINEDLKDEDLDRYLMIRELTLGIIKELYREEKFYKEMEKERPQFLDELFAALLKSGTKVVAERKIKTAQDLASINLGDEFLQKALFEILRGRVSSENEEETISLLDYIRINSKDDGKIRLQLARRPVLMALFHDDVSTVDDVIEQRYELYSKVSNEKMSTADASKAFQAMFSNRLGNNEKLRALVDFTVTKTNPRKYN